MLQPNEAGEAKQEKQRMCVCVYVGVDQTTHTFYFYSTHTEWISFEFCYQLNENVVTWYDCVLSVLCMFH